MSTSRDSRWHLRTRRLDFNERVRTGTYKTDALHSHDRPVKDSPYTRTVRDPAEDNAYVDPHDPYYATSSSSESSESSSSSSEG